MNIVRRQESKPAAPQTHVEWDPFRMLREVMRWDPFREMAPLFPREGRELMFVPDVDVKETPEGYVFKADLPGIADKDLELSLTGNRLTLNGKREEERREEKDTYYMTERSYGTFTRSFTLPAGADVEAIRAELEGGVLTITVPKKPEVQPKKIDVGAAAPSATTEKKNN